MSITRTDAVFMARHLLVEIDTLQSIRDWTKADWERAGACLLRAAEFCFALGADSSWRAVAPHPEEVSALALHTQRNEVREVLSVLRTVLSRVVVTDVGQS